MLRNRQLQDIATLMYKVKNDLCPPYILKNFSKKIMSIAIALETQIL